MCTVLSDEEFAKIDQAFDFFFDANSSGDIVAALALEEEVRDLIKAAKTRAARRAR